MNAPRCVRLASAKAEEIVALLKGALEQHEVQRVQARVRRHRQQGAAVPAPGPSALAATAMLVDTAGGEETASGRELAAELGIDLSDDDEVMASSSSSGEDSEPSSSSGGEDDEEDAGAATGAGHKSGLPKTGGSPQLLARGACFTLGRNTNVPARQILIKVVTIPSHCNGRGRSHPQDASQGCICCCSGCESIISEVWGQGEARRHQAGARGQVRRAGEHRCHYRRHGAGWR